MSINEVVNKNRTGDNLLKCYLSGRWFKCGKYEYCIKNIDTVMYWSKNTMIRCNLEARGLRGIGNVRSLNELIRSHVERQIIMLWDVMTDGDLGDGIITVNKIRWLRG